MTEGKRVGRIVVWPSYEIALEEDTEVSNVLRRMTVWPSEGLARENTTSDGDAESTFAAATFASTGIQSVNATKPWTPADLGSELRAWFPFDRLVGSNGTAISSLTDASGNGLNSGPQTGTNRGTIAAADLNSKNVLNLAQASGQAYSWGATNGSTKMYTSETAGSVYVVVKSAGLTNMGLFNWGTDANPDHWPSDGNGFIFTDWGSTTTKDVGGPGAILTSYHIYGIHSAAGDWSMYIDGGIYSGGVGAAFFHTATNTVAWQAPDQIFAHGGTVYFNGKVAEMIFSNAKQSASNRQKVEGFLAHKWGLAANLDAAHPYKSAPP